MSKKQERRIRAELKPFFTLLLVVAGTAFLASCGGGSDSTTTDQAASDTNGMMTAQAVSTGTTATVPGTWTGRVPAKSFTNTPNTSFRNYSSSAYVVKGELSGNTYIRGELKVYLKSTDDLQALQSYISTKGYTIVFIGGSPLNDITIQTNTSSESALFEVAKDLKSLPYVKYWGVNQPASKFSFDDTAWTLNEIYRRPLASINFESALALARSVPLSPVAVHVLDDGFASHTDIHFSTQIGGLAHEANEWHGLAVASIIGAAINNADGITGITPNVTLRTSNFKDFGDATEDAVDRAFNSAASTDFRVINMSWGSVVCNKKVFPNTCDTVVWNSSPNASVNDLYRNTLAKYRDATSATASPENSKLIVKASGNDGEYYSGQSGSANDSLSPHIPTEITGGVISALAYFSPANDSDRALMEEVSSRLILVGSYTVDATGKKSLTGYTQLPRLDTEGSALLKNSFILAPGGDVGAEVATLWGAKKGDYFMSSLTGTSFAAPHVTGVAGLILRINPSLSASSVRDIILSTAAIGSDGYKYLNAEAAVKEAINRKKQANCGTISAPVLKPLAAPTVTAGVPYTYTVSTTAAPTGGRSFASYQWSNSEGWSDIAFITPDMPIKFNSATPPPPAISMVSVTPVLDDGTVCTGAKQTTQVSVMAPVTSSNVLLGAYVSDSCISCSVYVYGAPSNVTDGNTATARNLGTYSGTYHIFPANAVNLGRVKITPDMAPNGVVDFEIQTSTDPAGAAGTWISHGRMSRAWVRGNTMEFALNPGTSGVRVVRINIFSSPSWVSLFEVEGYSDPPISALGALLSDDFTTTADLTGWQFTLPWNSTYKTTDYSLTGGYLQLSMLQTDKGANVLSPKFASSAHVRVTARMYLHPGPSVFLPNIALMDESADPVNGGTVNESIHLGFQRSSWGPDYACSGYDLPRVLDRAGCMTNTTPSAITSSSLYDRWITTVIDYDSTTGKVLIDYNGDGVIDFSGYVNPSHRFRPTRVSFNGFGWYTGHYIRIDSVKVEGL